LTVKTSDYFQSAGDFKQLEEGTQLRMKIPKQFPSKEEADFINDLGDSAAEATLATLIVTILLQFLL
jgi:hypothetical protein